MFFDGMYRTSDPGPFPFVFTLGCLEMTLPSSDSQSEPERSTDAL